VPAHLIVFSQRPEDQEFGQKLANKGGFIPHQARTLEEMQQLLVDHTQAIVFWDAESGETVEKAGPLLTRGMPQRRIFAITDQPLNQYPTLLRHAPFGHHLFRRYADPAPFLYARLAHASFEQTPFGVLRYFPEGAFHQQIRIVRSGHKRAAVEAIQSYLNKLKLNSRLAALIAQASDELMMNAIFDAPVNKDGVAFRRAASRDADYDLPEKERVQVEVAACEEYAAFSVADQFGSLKKSTVLGFFGKDYQEEKYLVRKQDPGAGLGLYGIIQSGVSLLFVSKPGVRTEVMIFFPRGQKYQEFRSGFRFATIISE